MNKFFFLKNWLFLPVEQITGKFFFCFCFGIMIKPNLHYQIHFIPLTWSESHDMAACFGLLMRPSVKLWPGFVHRFIPSFDSQSDFCWNEKCKLKDIIFWIDFPHWQWYIFETQYRWQNYRRLIFIVGDRTIWIKYFIRCEEYHIKWYYPVKTTTAEVQIHCKLDNKIGIISGLKWEKMKLISYWLVAVI